MTIPAAVDNIAARRSPPKPSSPPGRRYVAPRRPYDCYIEPVDLDDPRDEFDRPISRICEADGQVGATETESEQLPLAAAEAWEKHEEGIGDPRGTPAETEFDQPPSFDDEERVQLYERLSERLRNIGHIGHKPPLTTEYHGCDVGLFERCLQRLIDRQTHSAQLGIAGCRTGLPELDAAIGGIQDVAVIAGRPATGKTSFAAQAALAALEHDPDLAVVYWLLDDVPLEDFHAQLLCNAARVDIRNIHDGSLSNGERRKIREARERLETSILPRWRTVMRPDYVDFGLTAQRIFWEAAKLSLFAGASKILTVIDMFQNMPLAGKRFDPEAGTYDYREANYAAANPDLWRMEQIRHYREATQHIQPHGWPVLLLAKLRKPVGRTEEVGMEDVFGPVDATYMPRQVMLLAADAGDHGDKVPATLSVEKARHGRCITLSLTFHIHEHRLETRKAPAASKGDKRRQGRGVDPFAGMGD